MRPPIEELKKLITYCEASDSMPCIGAALLWLRKYIDDDHWRSGEGIWEWKLEDQTVVRMTAVQACGGFSVRAANAASDGDPFVVDGSLGGRTTGTVVELFVHNSPRTREMLRAIVEIMEEYPDGQPEERVTR